MTDKIQKQIVARADQLGLTAYAVAKRIDVDPGIVRRYFTGARSMNSAYVSRICEVIGLKLVTTRPRKVESE